MKLGFSKASYLQFAVVLVAFAFSHAATADSALILKGGSHQLQHTREYVNSGFFPIRLDFDDRSTSALGVEYEWRFPKNFAVGGEISGFRHEWYSSTFGTAGDLATVNVMVNGKKYFVVTDWFNPFVGIGVGIVTADFEGPGGSATLSGFGGQAMAGVEFRFKHVGIYTEVRQFYSQPEDDVGETIDISGTGVYGGLSIHF